MDSSGIIERVIELRREGLRSGQIARELNRSERTIRTWMRALDEGREPMPRPQPISDEKHREILRLLGEGKGQRETARLAGVSVTSVMRIRDTRLKGLKDPTHKKAGSMDEVEREACAMGRKFHELAHKWVRKSQ